MWTEPQGGCGKKHLMSGNLRGSSVRWSIILVVASLWCVGTCLAQEKAVPPESPQERTARLQWWREARFGMFIHWGPVSLLGTELSWSRGGERRGIAGKGDIPVETYDSLYRRFNPMKYSPARWVSLAQSAGMRYMVFTAKHHDGFALWPTAQGTYHIGNSPFGRDICGELAQAAHDAGMRLGWYYSPPDWRDPDCRTERNSSYLRRMHGHLQELLGKYGPIDLVWFDTDGGPSPWDQESTYRLVRTLQPRVIINNRLEMGGEADYRAQRTSQQADYYTPEQRVGGFDNSRPWETCMTLGTQWAWKPNDRIKPAAECIRILAQCASGDGNLLLNVGPMPDGEIEPRQAAVLEEIGGWLAKYGESIYGTRGGPFRGGIWGGSTRRGNAVYLHILHWRDTTLTLPPLSVNVRKATALTGGLAAIDQTSERIVVRMPRDQQDTVDTIVKLEMAGLIDDLDAVEVRSPVPQIMQNCTMELATPPSPHYPGGGAPGLVDGVRASYDHQDGRWLGFEGEDFEGVIQLQRAAPITKVVIGCLQNQSYWIFLPLAVGVAVSEDGKTFVTVVSVRRGEPLKDSRIAVDNIEVSFPQVRARFVRIRAATVGTCPSWHSGSGGKAWLFLDEVTVE